MKCAEVYTEAKLGGDLYEFMMKIAPIQDHVLTAVKRDSSATDLSTWNRYLGHLGDSMLTKLINSSIVKEMIIMDTHLNGTCED